MILVLLSSKIHKASRGEREVKQSHATNFGLVGNQGMYRFNSYVSLWFWITYIHYYYVEKKFRATLEVYTVHKA